jgi:hypothetical protein
LFEFRGADWDVFHSTEYPMDEAQQAAVRGFTGRARRFSEWQNRGGSPIVRSAEVDRCECLVRFGRWFRFAGKDVLFAAGGLDQVAAGGEPRNAVLSTIVGRGLAASS